MAALVKLTQVQKRRALAVLAVLAVLALVIWYIRRKPAPGEPGAGDDPLGASGVMIEPPPQTSGAPSGKVKAPPRNAIDDAHPIQDVRGFQLSHPPLSADGKLGAQTLAAARLTYYPCEFLVTPDAAERFNAFWRSILRESGGSASHIMWDGEFRCLWPANRACINRLHYGVTAGINQAVQHAGSLGRVIERAMQKNYNAVNEALDGHADEVLALTTAEGDTFYVDPLGDGEEKVNPKTRRLSDGRYLWEEPWKARIQRLWLTPVIHESQLEVMDERYLQRALDLARQYGFSRRAEFAVIADSANHLGVGGTKNLLERAFPNGRTPARNADILRFIDAYRHESPAARQKVINRRLSVLAESHPGVCYAA